MTTDHKFFVELIKPSHYDDDGYVIKWWKAFSISNSLACLYGLTLDAARKRVLGDDVQIIAHVYDDAHTAISSKKIIRRIQNNGGRGIICLVGVQSNEYPRAVDMARPFCQAGIPSVIGGFHVSGSLAMLPEIPADLQQALDIGITLFAGEAEGRIPQLFSDAYHGKLQPIYNYLRELPDLQGHPLPYLPRKLLKKSLTSDIPIDTSRGCLYNCSFCTIINVQGKKSRVRSVDEVEKIVRNYYNRNKKNNHFFITDDNFARSKHWEAVFDRFIAMREKENLRIKFGLQIDTQAHKIKRFVDKAARAGCNSVFIGMESINPQNLQAANKPQNKAGEYKDMLSSWRNKKIVTMAGYILGFPADTPESIEQDIKTIQRELPIDILMFFSLTPLPGSQDHLQMVLNGEWMEPDLNKYDSIHATMNHPNMSLQEWEDIFRRAWNIYYSPEHVRLLLKRALQDRVGPSRLLGRIFISHCGMNYEKVHPFQYGALRRKIRTQRRFAMPVENPLLFYPRRLKEIVRSAIYALLYFWKLSRVLKKLKREVAQEKKQ